MEDDIKLAKPAIDLTCLLGLHMVGEEDSLGPHSPFLPEVFPPPEDRMEPEDPEDRYEKHRHQNKSPVKDGLPFPVGMGCVGKELNEILVGTRVALATGLYEARLRNEGLWIVPGQDAVKAVAVGTAGNQSGIAQLFDLS